MTDAEKAAMKEAADCLDEQLRQTVEWRQKAWALEKERDELSALLRRARNSLKGYQGAYGLDHRCHSLAVGLDKDASRIVRDIETLLDLPTWERLRAKKARGEL